MANKIYFNNQIFDFQEEHLPCVIHSLHGAGGSLFTVSLLANLFKSGSKILFFTAYPMAKDEFLKQTGKKESEVNYITHINQLNPGSQTIIIESGNQNLYLQVLNKLNDLNQRVVLLKNIETLNKNTIQLSINFPKLIISGDFDASKFKNIVNQDKLKTIIAFNKFSLMPNIANIEKFEAYMNNQNISGIIKTKIN